MFGPFQTKEAGKIIMDLAKDKLLPAVTDLEKLAIEVADFKMNLLSSFFRKKLNSLNSQYRNKNKSFFAMYHLYSTPDDLFKDIQTSNGIELSEKDGKIMIDYFGSRQIMLSSFGDGLKLLEIIERQLSRYYQSADQRVATILSLIAITIAIISSIIS